MKSLTLALILSLGSHAFAFEPAINCLQWNLTTENDAVSSSASEQQSKSILANGATFGMVLESKETTDLSSTLYYFRYDRDAVLQDQSLLQEYEDTLMQLQWHLNEQMGYNFSCSFSADGPNPSMSGSN